MSAFAAPRPAIEAGRVQLVHLRYQSLLTARWRVLWVAIIFALVALAGVIRIVYLGFGGDTQTHSSLAEQLLPPRGEITDRNGKPMARAFPAYALWFDPKAMGDGGSPLVNEPEEVAASLKQIFPTIDETRIARRLEAGKAGYLRRRVLPEDANMVYQLGEIALQIPRETDRHYPQGTLASHVLGYVASDDTGRLGMESVLNDQLADPELRDQPTG